ncbi:MAG TPA: iron-containing alcohol dehydrogenase [Polyangia bacterium]|nr:iron-containing alcohol dehydrogenase [Polyangia bacterium]
MRALGTRALVVTGRSPVRAAPLSPALQAQGVVPTVWPLPVAGEPTVDSARAGVAAGRAAGCDVVVAIGGGGALDAAKAIAALLGNNGDPLDYLEVVGRGQPLERPSLPLVAIPTTAGTGSEVTRNAVLASPEHRVKASLRSPLMLPRLAVVDPDLLRDLPPRVIASGGLDALSQLCEPFLSSRANPVTDGWAREGIRRSARALRAAFAGGLSGGDAATAALRADLACASLLGGLCLANAGLGAVHGLAAPLGGMFDAPHGALCAALLPQVLAVNLRALGERDPENPVRHRFDEIAVLLTGRPEATAADGVAWVHELSAALRIPRLALYGLAAADIPALVAKAKAASSMKANPIALTDNEIAEITSAAM